MGQYYQMIILGDAPSDGESEIIRLALHPHNYNQGSKLMEHSYIKNKLVELAEYMLCPMGMFYKSRAVWAGDYAAVEVNTQQNLYNMAQKPHLIFDCGSDFNQANYRYIVNHTKHEYVDKLDCIDKHTENYTGLIIHPLPLLISEGNGLGNGDYVLTNKSDCGRWARDIISMERDCPSPESGYTQYITRFESD